MKRSLGLSLLAVAFLWGCGDSGAKADNSSSANTSTESSAKAIKIGMVFDTGGIGDKSFNDSANAGLEAAKAELGAETLSVQSQSPGDYGKNIEQMASQGCDLVVAVGLGMDEFVGQVAPKYPDVKFAVVDGSTEGANVRSLRFREEQGSFLAGYLAGLTSKTGSIGFVGGMEIPLIKKFQYGYWAGAKMANPNIKLLPAKFTLNWDSQDKGKAAAVALYSAGADIVYHAAGRAGLGVFKAAEETKKYAIGVDSDQDDIVPGTILTSMVKRVDQAVLQTAKDLKEGKFEAGEKLYGLDSNGVGLTEMRHTKDMIGEEVLGRVNAIKDQIIKGEITAPATEEEYKEFLKKNNMTP